MKKFGLCVDGGGVGGIGPCAWLAKSSIPQIDFGGGTSIGSVIVAMLAMGNDSKSLPAIFSSSAPKIFCHPGLEWELDPRKPKFNSIGLESTLKNVLGAATKISDTKFPVFIAAHDWNTNRPKIYDSTDSELLWEVCAESCSAPTYFPPRKGIADGGTVANNPSMVAITGYEDKFGVDFKDQVVLSLGTGGDFWKNPNVSEYTNKLEWAEILLANPTRGNEMLATFQAQRILKFAYLRVMPILSSDYNMADVSVIPSYGRIWEALHDLRKEETDEFLKQLN